MNTTRSILIVVALVGLALAGWFLFQRDAGPADGGRAVAVLPAEEGEAPHPPGTGDSEPPSLPTLDEQDDTDAAPSGERTLAPDAIAASGDSPFPLEDAVWVDVLLETPPGSPPDPDLVVSTTCLAVGGMPVEAPDDRSMWRAEVVLAEIDSGIQPESATADAQPIFRSHPMPEGEPLRVPFPPGATNAVIDLRGRYLFLREQLVLDLAGGDRRATLRPELGGRLLGRVVLPLEAQQRGLAAGRFEAELELQGLDFKRGLSGFGGRGGDRRELELEGELEFSFDALDPDLRWALTTDPDDFAPFLDMKLELEPGRDLVYELALQLGATISGRVTDEAGLPVEGAQVHARTGGGMVFSGAGFSESVETDERGQYHMAGIRPATVSVRVRKRGYLGVKTEELELVDGQVLADFDHVLGSGLGISGRVLWPDDSPAAGARVRVQRRRGERKYSWLDSVQSVTADEDGGFALQGLEQDSYVLTATAVRSSDGTPPSTERQPSTTGLGYLGDGRGPTSVKTGSSPLEWRATREDVAAGSAELTLTLEQLLALRGRVVDDRGDPVESFVPSATPVGGPGYGATRVVGRTSTSTESDPRPPGSFTILGLEPGEHRIDVQAEGYRSPQEPVLVRVPQSGAELVVTLSREGSVAGSVHDPAGAPVPGALVRIGTSSPGGPGLSFQFGESEHSEETDAEGRFDFATAPLGGFFLTAGAEGWADSEPELVELEPGQRVDDLRIALRRGGTILGEIFDEQGEPDPGRQIVLGASGFEFFAGEGDGGLTSDSAGRFRFEHVTPGEQVVTASPREDDFIDAMSEGEDNPAAFTRIFSSILTEKVTVVDGEEVHVRLGAEPKRPVRIHGLVLLSDAPQPERMVFALAEGSSFMQGLSMGQSDASGRYELVVDRPGAYTVGVQGSRGDSVEFSIDVPAAEEYPFDLVLPDGGLRGTVFKPDGSPAAGTLVTLTDDGGRMRLTQFEGGMSTSCDGRGEFRFSTLWPGTYTLRAGGLSTFNFGTSGETGTVGLAVLSGVEVEADRITEGVEIHLTDAGSISGTVRDGEGKPAAEVSIFVRDAGGRVLAPVTPVASDPAGHFRYTGVAPGTYSVHARSGDSATVAEGVRVERDQATQLELELAPGTVLVIEAIDAERQPVRAHIQVFDSSGQEVGGMYSRSFFETAISEGISSKLVRIGPLPPDRYQVIGRTSDGLEAKKTVTVRGQDERKLKLRLKD